MLKKQYSKSKPVCKVTFSLPKEAVNGANEVKVLGDFNSWSWEEGLTMKADKEAFKATIELETGRHYEFRYMTDDKTWINDWEADAYYPTPYGPDNSVVFIDKIETPAPKAKKAAPKKATTKRTPTAKTTATRSKATAKTSAKKATNKDDLKKIEGIGPKIASLLNAKGIHTFEDLSKAKEAQLQAVLDEAGSRFRMHKPGTWTQQAKLAAQGKWDKLKQLQQELKGGKKQ